MTARRLRPALSARFCAPGLGATLAGLLTSLVLLAGCAPSPTAPAASPTASPAPASATPSPTATRLPANPTPSPALTATPEPAATEGPAVTWLAFDTQRDGNGEIYLLDAGAGGTANVTGHPAEDRGPAWSPDGLSLAFESRRDGNWDLYVLDLVDGSIRRLTDDAAFDGAAAWSPDGSTLAFESYRDGNLEIYAVPAAGGAPSRLTDHPAGDYGPAWSPDGGDIAFTSWRDGDKEIYTVPAGGGEAQNLSRHPADDEDPAWSPDGSSLAFVSWRDADAESGNRNAEIYRLLLADGSAERLTHNPWPDLDPAYDAEGRLVWSAYDPGDPFETYDPYRPGDTHLYRMESAGPVRLTGGDWDDRRPAPGPEVGVSPALLAARLPAPPKPADAEPTPAPGSPAQVVEVPTVLAGPDGPPVLVNEWVAPSLVAWQREVESACGWDYLNVTHGTWRPIGQVGKRIYGYLSWHKAGRALDGPFEYLVDGADQVVIVREDLGESVFWRTYLRTARQDGSMGEPLKENPWLRWWWIAPKDDPAAYEAGGKRLPIPAGYYVDVTALGKRHGWERIASYEAADYDWRTNSDGTEYWHFERTDGLTWWQAMQQIYAEDVLLENVGWEAGKKHGQTDEMMLSKGVPR